MQQHLLVEWNVILGRFITISGLPPTETLPVTFFLDLFFHSGCSGSVLWHTGLVAFGTWDLSLPTRDSTHVLCIGKWILNHQTTMEVLLT